MGIARASPRYLPDGTPLHNRLLAALPDADYARVLDHLRLKNVVTGDTLQANGARITEVYFPNGGVFSVTNQMRDGALVEVATIGREGMLGIGAFFGDRTAAGRTFQQVADGLLPSMTVARFVKETAAAGPFREVMGVYAQANLLQIMQCTACNALHDVSQRCCRWLLQTHDRVEGDEFELKHEFLAIMLGVHRPTVTVVLKDLQRAGLITSRYGRIRILKRTKLEAASCECHEVIRTHFARLGLSSRLTCVHEDCGGHHGFRGSTGESDDCRRVDYQRSGRSPIDAGDRGTAAGLGGHAAARAHGVRLSTHHHRSTPGARIDRQRAFSAAHTKRPRNSDVSV
jgi:CRP-like cAMP-binding protein